MTTHINFLQRATTLAVVAAAVVVAASCGGGSGGGSSSVAPSVASGEASSSSGSGTSTSTSTTDTSTTSGTSTGGTSGVITASCTSLYAQSPLVPATGTTAHNEDYPIVAKPAKGVAMLEETYGTCRVRATDHTADGLNTYARNDYSRRQAFNADSSRYLVYARDGAWWLYDAQTFAKLKSLPPLAGDAEPQWHATNPNLLYYIPRNGGLYLYELDVSTSPPTSRVAADFAAKGVTTHWPTATRVWTHSEGSPSADSRYWAFMVEDVNFALLGFITWDNVNKQVIAYHDIGGDATPNHLSMSPSGRYVVVSWDGGSATNPGPTVFNRDFTNRRLIYPDNPRGEHSDIALDSNGNDVYVSVDVSGSTPTGYVYMVTITDTTLTKTNLFSIWEDNDASVGTSTALHFSGKAFSKPGWALISTYSGYGLKLWMKRKVIAVKLAANPTIYHLAHTHEIYNTYATEPHATVNRDFTKIMFNSNWDVNTATDIDVYMLQLPAGTVQ